MAGNRIQIRRGDGTPSGLLPYELGWSTSNKILYINDNNNAIEGVGLRYINTTDNNAWTADTLGATTSIAFTKTNITGAYTTGHMVWLNANDIGTPFQLVVHDSSDLYLYKRWKSSGTWQAWTKMRAGYADSAGSATSATSANALNFVHTNELILGNETSQSRVWFNYRRVQGGAASGNTAITEYRFGNSNGGTTGVTLYADSFTGNAATATKLATARTVSLTGSVTGSGSFDGSGNLSIATTTNHTHSYLPLTGGTMNDEKTVTFQITRKKDGSGGWAYSPINMIGNDNAMFFNIGVYGTANTLGYAYIGANAWNSTANARVYLNGTIQAGGCAVIRDSGTTNRRIFVTTSASVPSGAVAGDIVLVKA